jgi:hypothetical protein
LQNSDYGTIGELMSAIYPNFFDIVFETVEGMIEKCLEKGIENPKINIPKWDKYEAREFVYGLNAHAGKNRVETPEEWSLKILMMYCKDDGELK